MFCEKAGALDQLFSSEIPKFLDVTANFHLLRAFVNKSVVHLFDEARSFCLGYEV